MYFKCFRTSRLGLGHNRTDNRCKAIYKAKNKKVVGIDCLPNETNSLIDDELNGFRLERSCEYHIFTLTSILRNSKNAYLDTLTCFVDTQKAFDRVNRDILYTKLAKIGVTGNFLDTLKQLYTDCQAAVDVNGTYTAFLKY